MAGYGIYIMQKSSDAILKDLSMRLMNRKLFKYGDEDMREEIEESLKKYGSFKKYYFFEEVNLGTGLKFPAWIRTYMTWGLPVIVLYIFISGYYAMFFK